MLSKSLMLTQAEKHSVSVVEAQQRLAAHMAISFSWKPARQPSLSVVEITVHQKAIQQRLRCYFL